MIKNSTRLDFECWRSWTSD